MIMDMINSWLNCDYVLFLDFWRSEY